MVPSAISAPSAMAPPGDLPPRRNWPRARLACEPASTRPMTKAPATARMVQPMPTVEVNATRADTSTITYSRNRPGHISRQRAGRPPGSRVSR
ncbi:Uncharacterised protein [Mycobacteroides abscessus subsp. abscessus]|nr:Uncharacterised protein [Mycobacteroides abscessus subsp. abscessus]